MDLVTNGAAFPLGKIVNLGLGNFAVFNEIDLLTAESGKDTMGKEVFHESSVPGRGERGAVRRWMAERIVADQDRTVSARRSPPGMSRVVRLRRGRRRTGVGR